MYRNKQSGRLGIIITIIILILLIILTNVNIEKLSYAESLVSSIVMPVQNGLTYMKNKIQGNNAFFTDINNIKEENQTRK